MSEPATLIADTLSLSITGHRPKDLIDARGYQLDIDTIATRFVARAASWARAAGLHQVIVITGGALGVDQAVADAVTRAAAAGGEGGITFLSQIVLPFPASVMGRSWAPADQARLARLIEAAESCRVLGEGYAVWLYQQRNEAMVDASDGLVAFWNGKTNGGTYNCIEYALRKANPRRRVRNALADYAEITLDQLKPSRAAKSDL